MPKWRWRKCPACGEVEAAGDYATLDFGSNWHGQPARRECPNCHAVFLTPQLIDVREKHPAVAPALSTAATMVRSVADAVASAIEMFSTGLPMGEQLGLFGESST